MKSPVFKISIYCLLVLSNISNAQPFTWMHGSSTSGQPGSYGTMGVPASANDPGGRHGCATWTDGNGDLWLFGGEGYSNSNTICWLNDLWKYNRSTNQWTWMRGSNGPNSTGNYGTQGVASPNNDPSAREFANAWTDNNGKLWLFGGEMGTSTKYNDLWKYDPQTNQWTWMTGSSVANQFGTYGTITVPAAGNTPGGRSGMATFTDASGKLWCFGGRGYTDSGFPGFLNDVWNYNPSTNQWAWMGGTNLTGQPASYGTQGVPSTTNIPSGRDFPAYCKDYMDRLYICGGRGSGYFSDLWRFDPANGTWVFLKGPAAANQVPVYGTTGNPAPGNYPGGRWTSACWTDNYGFVWMFGGNAFTTATVSPFNQCNDLWRYDPCSNNWTFMKGGQQTKDPGMYGTMGVPSFTNVPGARFFNNWWKDPAGDFWLFGGEGYDINGVNLDHMNDLWKFTIFPSADSINAAPARLLCTGASATLSAYTSNAPVNWYSSPTSTNIIFSGNPFNTPILNTGASPTVISYYAQTSCTSMPRAVSNITVYPYPVVSVAGPTGVCVGSQITFTATGASSYTWSNGATGSITTLNPAQIVATISAKGSNEAGCMTISNYSLSMLPLPNVTAVPVKTIVCRDFPPGTATVTGNGASTYTWNNAAVGPTTVFASTTSGVKTYTLSGTDANGCTNSTTFSISFFICGGIEESTLQNISLNLYPNPSSSQISLDLKNFSGSKHVSIYGSSGQLLLEYEVEAQKAELDVPLTPGIYYIVVKSENKRGQVKFIKTD